MAFSTPGIRLYKATGVASKPDDSYYYPGGDIGGPVIIPKLNFNRNHDKLFFYAAYEYMDQHPSGSVNERFIPTQEMMGGNFSPAYLATLGDTFKNGSFGNNAVAPCPSGCTATAGGDKTVTFPGGIIPASYVGSEFAGALEDLPRAEHRPALQPAWRELSAGFEPAHQSLGTAPARRLQHQ